MNPLPEARHAELERSRREPREHGSAWVATWFAIVRQERCTSPAYLQARPGSARSSASYVTA
jgi:hypothetical protein